ncbi:alkaline phosphatase D family protein [Parashewanella tropica]|uniref:alkaline phosphatase D family protein n=1 Tax=Parashewanella tropica TaxID=2547970 RepID=UPI001059D583|nr:alkaline phosphatase D family protein [Parashewanella tropica]
MNKETEQPLVIAGPILRKCDTDNFTLWLVTREPLVKPELQLVCSGKRDVFTESELQLNHIPLGTNAHQYLLHVQQPNLLPTETQVHYQLNHQQGKPVFASIDELTYPQHSSPHFVYKPDIKQLLHGSCRNPHHPSGDGLVRAEQTLAIKLNDDNRPSLLMLSGDQVYIDDIAGPMLLAIAQVVDQLGLVEEAFEQAPITGSRELKYDALSLYHRDSQLLPQAEYLTELHLFKWRRKHEIFTSRLSHNHLVSLGEMIAYYLLIWSPELWQHVDLPESLPGLSTKHQAQWHKEWLALQEFQKGLSSVRRLLAHIPTYMIFDDHDVTDDWNLSARWEQAAYEHPFAKQIIGNALIAYGLFQGLGNTPDKLARMQQQLSTFFKAPQPKTHQNLIQYMLRFEGWHYELNTSPKVIVLDTRTRRWRSENSLAKPSGLMDWEALMEFQEQLIDQDKVIIVSAAPIFGVKLIESIQRIATFCGLSLLVDAENWMAHGGAAMCLLNMFRHRRTPKEFVILSGDVHYSFAYDVKHRSEHFDANIYQICSSGIKNQFPEKLLPVFDKLNGWLYGHYSPLNWFTKRKRMSLRGRRPNGHRSKRLVNNSGIGLVALDENGAPSKIAVLHSDSSITEFKPPRDTYFE